MEEPDAGLDPKALGSCPEPKADAQRLSHPGAPKNQLFSTGKKLVVARGQGGQGTSEIRNGE